MWNAQLQNTSLWTAKAGSTYSYHWALNGYWCTFKEQINSRIQDNRGISMSEIVFNSCLQTVGLWPTGLAMRTTGPSIVATVPSVANLISLTDVWLHPHNKRLQITRAPLTQFNYFYGRHDSAVVTSICRRSCWGRLRSSADDTFPRPATANWHKWLENSFVLWAWVSPNFISKSTVGNMQQQSECQRDEEGGWMFVLATAFRSAVGLTAPSPFGVEKSNPRGKADGSWSLSLTSIWYQGKALVLIYLHGPHPPSWDGT
jgi:hypothetical protein